MFGNDEQDTLTLAEEGEELSVKVDTANGSEQKNGSIEAATAELSTTQYCIRLLFCIFGLQGAYLTWGVLQVGDCVDCPRPRPSSLVGNPCWTLVIIGCNLKTILHYSSICAIH